MTGDDENTRLTAGAQESAEDAQAVFQQELAATRLQLETTQARYSALAERQSDYNKRLLSANEKLERVNAELIERNRQLQDNADTLARQYAELETLYATTPVGLSLLDMQLRYLRINEPLAQINGVAIEDHIGRSQSELIADIDTKIRDQQLRVLETGDPSIGNEVRGYTPAEPDVERFWIADYYPVRTVDGEIFALGCCVREVTDQKRLQSRLEEALANLLESEERLEFALEAGQIGAWEYDLETEETERTPLHDEIFGLEDISLDWDFDRFLSYVVDADRDEVAHLFKHAVETRSNYELECRIRRSDGQLRWIEARSRPRLTPSGKLFGFGGIVTDITERKEAEQRQSLLLHELQHRVKNTLATTLAIIRFSARRAQSVDKFAETLSNRLHAIARTHDILTTQDWRGGKLREIVEKEIGPYADEVSERVTFEGDNPKLSAAQILALTLAFHELTTNAAKYGALSVPDGKVIVKATVNSDHTMDLVWREMDGPKVSPPDDTSSGFGSFLLKKVMGPDLEGTANIHYDEAGVVWTASFPLDH